MEIEEEVVRVVIAIIILVGVGRVLGKICTKFGFPEMIGFVITGIILGPYAIGGQIELFGSPLVQTDGILAIFAQIAAIIILFAAGLHFTFSDLKKIGPKAGVVSGIEFLLSVFVTYYIAIFFGFEWATAAIIAAAFGATSIAVSVTVLGELRKEENEEAKLLVNIAVLDDILGLAVLSAVTALVISNSGFDISSIVFTTTQALGFWFLLVISAVFILPKIIKLVRLKGTNATTDVAVIGSAFGFATIAQFLGLNPIIGSFAAGMGLAGSHIGKHVREYVDSLKFVAAPLFFAVIGANIDLSKIGEINIIVLVVFLVIAIGTKVLGSGIPSSILLKSKNKGFKVGLGMIARSEVAFITVGVGLSTGIISNDLYSTLALVILGTVFISPTLLRLSYKKNEK